jgi:hypothetical protein
MNVDDLIDELKIFNGNEPVLMYHAPSRELIPIRVAYKSCVNEISDLTGVSIVMLAEESDQVVHLRC